MIDFKTIEEIRLNKNISVLDMCEILEINKSTYSRWINYKIDPGATKLKKLCDLLEINISEIFKQ